MAPTTAIGWLRTPRACYAKNLFGAFQRLHTPDECEGSGSGLATVQRILRRHGDKV